MRVTKRLHVCAVAVLVSASSLSAGQRPHNIHLSFDYSTFRYDSVKTYVEFHYAFNKSSISYLPADSAFSGAVILSMQVRPVNTDTLIYGPRWKVPVAVSDTTEANLERSAVGQVAAVLPPGDYNLSVNAEDAIDSANVDTFSERLIVPRYDSSKLEVSDIELCSTIASAGSVQEGIFYKNTYDVVPNPSDIYGVGLPIVYYYAEIYNIPSGDADTAFTIGYHVLDSYGQVVKTYNLSKKKFASSSVEVGTINASNLKTGVYRVDFTAADSGEGEISTSSRRFFVYNPHLGSPVQPPANGATASVLSSAFASMGIEQLDKEFSEARYVSTPADRDQYKKLTDANAKREFLYEFWKKLSSNPEANTSDFRSQYLERVAYSNQHYSVGGTEGWKTDRGRVYIVYGKPDEIDRHPNESNSKPYEIWYFNSVEGGVSFDFVDRSGFGDYILVNSTVRNEIHNDNWQEYLGTGGQY